MLPPQGRRVRPQALVLAVHDRVRDADVGEHELAHAQPCRQQQVAGLQPAEGHGAARRRRRTQDGAGPTVHARRHVDRHHRLSAGTQPLDHGQRRPSSGRSSPAPNSASTTSPAPSSPPRRHRLDRPRPAARRPGGVALQPLARRPGRRRGPASRRRRGGAPPRSRRRHCCRARTGPAPAAAGSDAVIARVTARPAFSISHGPGKPDAIAALSTAPIAAGVSRIAPSRHPAGARHIIRCRASAARSIAAATSRSTLSRWRIISRSCSSSSTGLPSAAATSQASA